MKILFLVIALFFGSISISLGQEIDTLSQKENLMKDIFNIQQIYLAK